jgi:cell division protein FtsL
MNATTRFAVESDLFTNTETQSVQAIWGISVTALLVLMAALSLIYVKDLNRQLYSELESLQQNHEELKIQKDQLLLEQNTWAAQARVQEIAQGSNMVLPDQSTMIILGPVYN